ncbi:MAG: hypothetical protein FWD04_00350 [Conexibacteraceae bacterium]|nr:hypothetical protein [Conexibacteraceae bacterium]
MRKVLGRSAVAIVAFLAVSGAAVAVGAPATGRSTSMVVRMPAGATVARVEIPEPAGVIRLLRVVAPGATRVKVSGVIPGLAGVSIAVPQDRRINAETCSRHGSTTACNEQEEACPMPPATWHFRVRKVAGPAGQIRIDFVVGSEHSA